MVDVDRMLDMLAASGLTVERLRVTHDADDDNLWFLRRPGSAIEVQIECAPTGKPPYLIESDDARFQAESMEEAIATIECLLSVST